MRGRRWGTPIVVAVALLMALAPPRGGAADTSNDARGDGSGVRASSTVETVRLAGDDRYATAATVAGTFDPAQVDNVILASGEDFPDAVSAAGLAGFLEAPVLLTRRGSVPGPTMDALDVLGPDTVWILGGFAAVSEEVEGALLGAGFTVERVAGPNRFATAAEAARRMSPPAGASDATGTALVAWGGNFPDAVAIGPLAYADAIPVLFVRTTSIPDPTHDALEDLNIEQVIIAGGTAVVSEGVAAQLETITGNPVIRVAGPDRYATAAEFAALGLEDGGFSGSEIILAYGLNFPDALSAGPYGGRVEAPIVLSASLRAPTREFLEDLRGTITTITAVGGPAVISEETLADARDAASMPPLVSWDPESVEVEVPAGGNVPVTVSVTLGDGVEDASLTLSESAAALVAAFSPEVEGDVAPGTYDITLGIFAPRDADVGSVIEGTLAIHGGSDEPVDASLPISITAGEPDPDAASRVNLPAPGDVAVSMAGLLATNEIEMAPDTDAVEGTFDGDVVAAAEAIAARHGAEVIGRAAGPDIFQLLIETIDDPDALRVRWEEIDADAEVAFAGPRLFGDTDAVFPNDPRWDDWDQESPGGNNWHLEVLRAGDAWERQTGSDEVTVAIIDRDMDSGHEDLTFTNIRGLPWSTRGHGTHVAGIACADGDNEIGISGVAWECDLHGYEIGVPGSTGVDSLQAAEFMVQAAEDGARVVNMSFGLAVACDDAEEEWVQSAVESQRLSYMRAVARAQEFGDVLWVAAAGNRACDASVYPPSTLTQDHPATFISVAATNLAGEVSNFSNFGPTTTLAAPGGRDFGAFSETIFSTLPGNRYGGMLGTSMAAPIVSGTAALMFSANPGLSAAQANSCLRASTAEGRQIDDVAFNEINIDSALVCAENWGATQVSADWLHTCALISDRTARCWGSNFGGQLGDGTTTDRTSPVPVASLAGATQITAGADHSCALIDDGTARCWGRNSQGQLGDGTTTDRPIPVPVAGLAGATQINASSGSTCALIDGGTVRCWGRNNEGQLGDGTTTNRASPVPVTGLTGATQINATFRHTCALIDDGTAKCWGRNFAGELGDGTTTDRSTPVTVTGLAGATQIAAGRSYTCALIGDGTARCWGYNNTGQLGDGTTTSSTSLVDVAGLTGATQITTGGRHTCALIDDGTARCWGANGVGKLGDGTTTQRTSPVEVTGLEAATLVTAGDRHTCAVIDDGTARCWGHNPEGQLGDGTTTQRLTPVQVDPFD